MNKTESKSIVNHQSKRSWDNSGRRLGDASKIFNNLGFKPEIPLSLGLDLTINWTLNNLDSIIKSITKHGKGQD
jgi:nucleoside-diphosphate-sugar epimerase